MYAVIQKRQKREQPCYKDIFYVSAVRNAVIMCSNNIIGIENKEKGDRMSKKKWRKPEVIVLTRTKSEETVLDNCKTADNPPVLPTGVDSGCTNVGCGPCFLIGAS